MARRKQVIENPPIIWKFNSRSTALGIFIDDDFCWIGNERGNVFALDHDANVRRHFKLPKGVMALVGDAVWMYAGCNNGNVYDITGQVPRLAYKIDRGNPIDWIDIRDGLLAVSNADGKITLVDPESRVLWTHDGDDGCWTVRVDQKRVYHGDDCSVVAYQRVSGKELWRTKTGSILFGWQTTGSMYVGTAKGKVVRVAKTNGKKLGEYRCGNPVYSCATSPNGKFVFGACDDNIVCLDGKGGRLWEMQTDCGSAMSMQFHNERLYIVTTDGYLTCYDVSKQAIAAAQAGQAAQGKELQAPKTAGIGASTDLETTTEVGDGVELECVQDGNDLRMHVVTPGYQRDWFVQFPRDVREVGVHYVVDEVRAASQGGFYRAVGAIKRLV